MPLKIRIKPRQKFTANGCVLQNVSHRPIDILVLSDHRVVREEYKQTASREKSNAP